MKKTFILSLLTVFAIDQISKYFIRTTMEVFDSFIVVKDFFRITYIENTGISFGLFGGAENPLKRWILVILVSIAAISIIIYWFLNMKNSFLFNLSCGFIVGGAFGNLTDRILKGSVTDFIEVGYKELTWPVFNMADTFVTIGVILFIIHYFFYERKENASGSI
ncbi:MAG: signal peptidase II [Candidatus Goldbacteria bacterium]|nr:signal peptidase II [Candidatus Goldiibacteriota bacterium]